MTVTVKFLSLPNVVKMIGSKTVTIDFSGQTMEELLGQITQKYGKKVEKFLLDENGRLDMMLKVLRNDEEWIHLEQMDKPLRDGDRITIMLLAAGG